MTYFMATIALLVMVMLGVFLAVAVSGAVRSDHAGQRRVGAAPTPQVVDAAQEELRLRYARGEIDREEFLQGKIDLER